MKRTHAGVFVLLAAGVTGCAPVPYTVDWSELVLLPPDTAVKYLQSLPGSAEALAPRPDLEHCEFQPGGLRVAAGNPRHAQKTAVDLRSEARRVAAEKARTERELRRIEAAQRDRARWMRANGFADLANEQARLEQEHRDPARWAQLRGLPPEQADRAAAGMAREKAALDSRMRPVDEAMASERRATVQRLSDLEERERRLETGVNEALGRVHEIVPYDRVAFVVYRRFGGTMEIDVKYAVRDEPPVIDGCGFRLQPEHPETPATVRRIATALSALGAEGQAGVAAEPRIGAGRRYSARPDEIQQVTDAPGPGAPAVPPPSAN